MWFFTWQGPVVLVGIWYVACCMMDFCVWMIDLGSIIFHPYRRVRRVRRVQAKYFRLETFDVQPKVHQTLIDGLSTAGFSYVSGGNPNPADDLRPYKITEPKNFQFIAQVWSSWVVAHWIVTNVTHSTFCSLASFCVFCITKFWMPQWAFNSCYALVWTKSGVWRVCFGFRAAMTPPSTTAPTATSWTLRSTQRATALCWGCSPWAVSMVLLETTDRTSSLCSLVWLFFNELY